tara:strand:+ start:717 stop:1298 length:582 start_codon:yes stop_codon:yes gene_type:complete
MKHTVTDFLNVILSFLQKWHLPVCKLLNNGLSEGEIDAAFNQVGIEPTKELVELYTWRNGSPVEEGTPLDDVQVIPGYHFLSLKDAISCYLAMKDDSRWNPSWFPVFANGGGDFYAVDLSQSDGDSAPVVGFILGEIEQEIEYQSLTTMLLTFSECFEKGVVFKTKDGYLEMDDDQQAKIATRNNPEVEFWQS